MQVEAASGLQDNIGTADALRIAFKKGWLNMDFAVVPCDMVTNLEGAKLAELWMTMQAGFDADLGRRSRKHRSAPAGLGEDGRRGGLIVAYDTAGEGMPKKQDADFFVTAPHANPKSCSNLPEGEIGILLNTGPALAKEQKLIQLRHGLVRRHPDFKMHTTFRDAGIYFFPHWVLKFIERNPRLRSLRDVLPWLAKARWQDRRLAEKLGLVDILTGTDLDGGEDDDISEEATEQYDVGSMSTTRKRRTEPAGDDETPVDIPPILAYMPAASPSMFMRRVDTGSLFLFTSLHLAKSDPTQPSTIKIDPSATIGERAIVTGNDCLVGEKATIGPRANVKRSVIGAGCTVGAGARLIGCVLMEGAVVEENVKLEGCTIGRNARVGAKCVLKDCEVADEFFVEKGIEAKAERFVAFAGLEAASDEDEEDYDDDEDDDEEAVSDGSDDESEEDE